MGAVKATHTRARAPVTTGQHMALSTNVINIKEGLENGSVGAVHIDVLRVLRCTIIRPSALGYDSLLLLSN